MLTLQFVPYSDIAYLSSEERINKLLDIVKKDNIVLMQGRLKPVEETKLIQYTMEIIDKNFTGIEICTIYPEGKNVRIFSKLTSGFIKSILGHRDGLTIIGPANIVKEIKRDPNKIYLFTVDPSRRNHSKRKNNNHRRR